jgi:vacuolar-type H+-ATPase subunit E/Vma4
MPATAGPLLDQLRREADAAVAARTAQARAQADGIRDTAAAQRGHRRAALVAEREKALARQRAAERARVSQSTMHDVLTAREAFVARVFAEAERQLNALGGTAGLSARLAPLIAEALPFLDPDNARARCAAAVQPALRDALAAMGRGALPTEVDETVATGALFEDGTRTLRVDATLAARLRRMHRTLAIDVVRLVEEPAS